MVMLFALSMIFAGGVTYIIYQGLRIYYKLVVRYEDPLAQVRFMIKQIGDVNFFNYFHPAIHYVFLLPY